MKKEHRHDAILKAIEDVGSDRVLSTRELAQQFHVSEMTIRRDLQELADAGLIQRRHGGATTPRRPINASAQHGQIGIFLLSRQDKYTDPFFNLVFEGAQRKLQELGYHTAYIYTIGDAKTTSQARDLLQSHHVDGILLLGTQHTESVEYLKHSSTILVTVTGSLGPDHDAVLIDGYTSIYQLVSHLVKLGRRRLGFITGHYDSREQGFIEAVAAHNLPDDPALRITLEYGFEGWTPNLGERGAAMLMSLQNPPDAIVCASDRLAIGAMQWLHQNGMRVPDDIAITGFDNIPNSEFTIPPLTTVHVHKEFLGALAAERVVRRLENPGEIPLQICTPTYVIIRQSCGYRP